MQTTLPTWILAVQWASRLVLVLLFFLSIWSVSIMVDRFRTFKTARKPEDLDHVKGLIKSGDSQGLKNWMQQSTSPLAGTLKAAGDSSHPESIERAVRSFLVLERARLEQGLTALATLGSNAPFIGLFGTVLGIIQAFGALAASNSNTAGVMAGISEALVATAVGLFVAIPAVVAFNVYSRNLRQILVECESLRDYYVSRISHGR